MAVVDELKAKRDELSARIIELQDELGALERQQSAFDAVIAVYEPGYVPTGKAAAKPRKPPKVKPSSVAALFKGHDRRSFVLRTLREADKPISTADCAAAFARMIGLLDDDPRLGQIGNVLSRVLEQLGRSDRVRHAGMLDGHRRLWEISA